MVFIFIYCIPLSLFLSSPFPFFSSVSSYVFSYSSLTFFHSSSSWVSLLKLLLLRLKKPSSSSSTSSHVRTPLTACACLGIGDTRHQNAVWSRRDLNSLYALRAPPPLSFFSCFGRTASICLEHTWQQDKSIDIQSYLVVFVVSPFVCSPNPFFYVLLLLLFFLCFVYNWVMPFLCSWRNAEAPNCRRGSLRVGQTDAMEGRPWRMASFKMPTTCTKRALQIQQWEKRWEERKKQTKGGESKGKEKVRLRNDCVYNRVFFSSKDDPSWRDREEDTFWKTGSIRTSSSSHLLLLTKYRRKRRNNKLLEFLFWPLSFNKVSQTML